MNITNNLKEYHQRSITGLDVGPDPFARFLVALASPEGGPLNRGSWPQAA